jgi:hypothetical protein
VIDIRVIAAGRLDGRLLGADGAMATVPHGADAAMDVFLERVVPCTEGAVYCGGTPGIVGEIQSLYRCGGGVPIFYMRCSAGCITEAGQGVCAGGAAASAGPPAISGSP